MHEHHRECSDVESYTSSPKEQTLAVGDGEQVGAGLRLRVEFGYISNSASRTFFKRKSNHEGENLRKVFECLH